MFFISPPAPGMDPLNWLLANLAAVLALVVAVAGAIVFYRWLLKRRERTPRNPRLPTKLKIKSKETQQEENA